MPPLFLVVTENHQRLGLALHGRRDSLHRSLLLNDRRRLQRRLTVRTATARGKSMPRGQPGSRGATRQGTTAGRVSPGPGQQLSQRSTQSVRRVRAARLNSDAAPAANLAIAVPAIARRRQTVELAQTLNLATAATHLRAMVAQEPGGNVADVLPNEPRRIVGRRKRKLSHVSSFAEESDGIFPFPRLTVPLAESGRGVSSALSKKIPSPARLLCVVLPR
jgi:hypothetical protein